MKELPGGADVLPALRLVYSASSGSVRTVHQTDDGRELRHLGRGKVLHDTDLLMEFNCEEVEFLLSR
jgi:hypothetical protein